MSIWHKRLIIFLSKILGAILFIILICLFLYYNYYFKKDVFLKYTPKNALVYVSLNLNNKGLKDNLIFNKFVNEIEENYNFIALPWDNLNLFINYNAALAVIPEQDNSLSYLIMFNLDSKKIDNYLNQLGKNNWHYLILKNQVLERNILAISNSQKVLETVKLTSLKESPALAQKVSTVLMLKSFNHDSFGKIYINSKAVLTRLNQVPSDQLKFLSFVLKDSLSNDLYLGLKTIDQKILITSKEINTEEEKTVLSADIPTDYLAFLSFGRGQQYISQVLNNLKQYDLNEFNSLNQNLGYWQKLYNFDWQKDLAPFINGQTTLIMKADNRLLAILKPSQAMNQQQIEKLQEVIKGYLATANPVENEKIMPDYSKITQIVRQPNQYNFEKIRVNNIDLDYLNKDGREIVLAQKDNFVFLANNMQIMQDVLNKENLEKELKYFNNSDNNTNFSQNLYLAEPILQRFNIFIKKFQLNITENNRILLILE
ncbi:MAG: hypothetical protein NTX00_02105 [Candidatus Parcubacteria bacterium]|nr:hypothetical protein [Candidatus Parcubacteria bacterium]